MILLLIAAVQAISTGLDGNKEACFGIQGRKQGIF